MSDVLEVEIIRHTVESYADYQNDGEGRLNFLQDLFPAVPHTILRTYANFSLVLLQELLVLKESWLLFHANTLAMTVQICIGDKVRCETIRFIRSTRPVDTVKELVRKMGLLKPDMSLDKYRLTTLDNRLATSYESIERLPMLIFRDPERFVPLPDSEWTEKQLDQLQVHFEHVGLGEFFKHAEVSFKVSARGAALVDRLDDDETFAWSTKANTICSNPRLQHPICKALHFQRLRSPHTPFSQDFVKHLLDEMGFNTGGLYVAPRKTFNLAIGDTEKVTAPDVTVVDLLSDGNVKVCVTVDKEGDSTAQLVAGAIAIIQQNEAALEKIRDAEGCREPEESSTTNSDTVYGIRLLGSQFFFYAIHVSPEIRYALRNQTAAEDRTIMHNYYSQAPLDFTQKDERAEIIRLLSLLQEVAENGAAHS